MGSDIHHHPCLVPLGWVAAGFILYGGKCSYWQIFELLGVPCQVLAINLPGLGYHPLPHLLGEAPVGGGCVLVGQAGDVVP